MKIIWNENPLKTGIELDETERLLFREKYKTNYLIENCLYSAYHDLTSDHNPPTDAERIKRAVEALDARFIVNDNEDGQFEAFITDRANEYYAELNGGEHDGDCVRVACSCLKCYAGEIWGVDTIAGLRPGAYRVAGGFRAEGATLDTVIAALAVYDPGERPTAWPESVGWEQHHPRWKADAKHAHDWLVKYRADHF